RREIAVVASERAQMVTQQRKMMRLLGCDLQPVRVVGLRHVGEPARCIQGEVDRIELDVRNGVDQCGMTLPARGRALLQRPGWDQLGALRTPRFLHRKSGEVAPGPQPPRPQRLAQRVHRTDLRIDVAAPQGAQHRVRPERTAHVGIHPRNAKWERGTQTSSARRMSGENAAVTIIVCVAISTSPMNILLITSDQQRADGYGFENPAIRTPHIDRLAREGTRFSACITPNLVCQPSRASILTGLLPLTHGVWDNGVDLDPEVGAQGFAGSLAAAGYATAFIGKAHFATKLTFAATGTPECNKSQARYGPDWTGPYMGFEHVELCVLGHMYRTRPLEEPPCGHYERWLVSRGKPGEAIELWKQDLGPSVGAAQTWYSALPAAWHASTWIADRTIDYLAGQGRDKPFCLWASFPDPHHAFDCPEPWSRLYDPKSVRLPRHRTRDLERRPWWHKAVLEGKPQLTDPTMFKFRA